MEKWFGISLLELILVIFILSILVGLSLPEFNLLLQQKQGEATLRKLASAIQLAKTSAISSGHTVTLCRSADGNICGGQWRDGVILFTDINGDRTIGEDDALLQYVQFPDSAGELSFRAFQNKQYLQLTSSGFTRNQNGNFTYCPDNGQASLAKQLIINRTARLRYAIDSDGDGLKEDSQGKPIRCK